MSQISVAVRFVCQGAARPMPRSPYHVDCSKLFVTERLDAAILLSALTLLFGFFGSFKFSPDSSGETSFKALARSTSPSPASR
jgi:hypothetical protein